MKRQRFINLVGSEFEYEFSSGTHHIGYITTTLNKLRSKLGKPGRGWEKSSINFAIMLEDYTMFTIYDWKLYGKESARRNPDKEIEYNIGGSSGDIHKVLAFLYAILGEA